ncbi:MAG: T9SS type B sorting domain-containing protein [Chitinophagaceae bacterium]|nr:MAG: T9SS type B sorting domain-containing protein [Chitinophagaceae bacterium]
MRRILLLAILLITSKCMFAEHITGGEMYYTYIGMSGGKHVYEVTLKLFRNCGSVGAQLDESAAIGIFDRGSNRLLRPTKSFRLSNPTELNLTDPGKCITNAPSVCYQVGFYTDTLHLDPSTSGYTLAYQRCCRINGIQNLINSGNIGATYTAEIPGIAVNPAFAVNNSAIFNGRDTIVVCGGYPFTYSFGALDADGDELRYSFCNAFVGGSGGPNGQAAPNPPSNPPYTSVDYAFPFFGSAPMGTNVTINPSTGLITGVSPAEGIYVVTVCVQEVRNGTVIATQRKDIQIKAGGCSLAKPTLQPDYITCDGLNFDFTHPDNPLINTYYWEFGDPASGADNVSTLQSPGHAFSAPGIYTIKVVANRGQECSDSSTSVIRVFPGFFPAFSNAGVCITNPVQFFDNTTTNHGVVNYWQWSFGDANTTLDENFVQNPEWTYSTTGPKTVKLVVGNSVGCRDSIEHVIDIISKPPITLGFRDTLICSPPDDVQLQASGTGVFTWSPNTNITATNIANPRVSPVTTTTYFVELNQEGCVNTDSVLINVVDRVTLNTLGDPTTICLTDPVQLNIVSDALRYQWTPAATLDDPTLANPVATPTGTTTYTVTASIGSCTATDDITIVTVPYPAANAGPDTTICYNTPAFLRGSHNGNSFTWSPVSSLSNASVLNPVATPTGSQSYILSSFDTRGCPKPGRDTVLVTMMPRIRPYAGNDTLVVVGQPVQLNAEGGVSYTWSPATGLNDANIKNPVGIYNAEVDSIRYTVTVFDEIGCSDSAYVTVVVFKTNPYVFVPSGFTPNSDGINDILRPIAVGVERINYFRVFNRWGEMVFSTTVNGGGWDGRINGTPQASNVYVWMVSARDYTGKEIFLKGTTTLIR